MQGARPLARLLALLLLLQPSLSVSTSLLQRLNASAASVSAAVAFVLDSTLTPKPPYRLSLCAMVRNEEFYVQEWVLWHFLQGVQHFYLYDNESDDDTREYLQPLVERGLVTLKRAPGVEHGSVLAGVLQECFDTGAAKLPSAWVAHWDVDEFLVVPAASELNLGALVGQDSHLFHDYLMNFEREGVGAVVLHRMDFGSNGHDSAPTGLVVEEYTERLIAVRPGGVQYGKVIVRMDKLVGHKGTHDPPVMKDGAKAVFANSVPFVEGASVPQFEPFRLNHYLTRSHDECIDKSSAVRTRDSWRRGAGAAMCESHKKGSKTWYRVEHAPNFDAALSPATDAVSALLPLLWTQRNGTRPVRR